MNKQTDYSWIWIGALSGLTGGIVSGLYSQWQMDEFNRTQKRTQKEKYQEMYNGMQTLEARLAECKERTATKP
jgi:hypothetical protein